jgi:hypothetical protein
MVWLGPPSRGALRPRLHDPPYPGYREPQPKVPLKDRQRQARLDWVLMRVGTIVLVLTAAAFLVLNCVLMRRISRPDQPYSRPAHGVAGTVPVMPKRFHLTATRRPPRSPHHRSTRVGSY